MRGPPAGSAHYAEGAAGRGGFGFDLSILSFNNGSNKYIAVVSVTVTVTSSLSLNGRREQTRRIGMNESLGAATMAVRHDGTVT